MHRRNVPGVAPPDTGLPMDRKPMSSTTPPRQKRTGRQPIHTGDEWSLLAIDGDVLAVREIAYEGQHIVSTEDIHSKPGKHSRHRLSVDAVVAHYAREEFEADPEAFATLLLRTQAILGGDAA